MDLDVGGRSALATQDTFSLLFTCRTRADQRALLRSLCVGAGLGFIAGAGYLAFNLAQPSASDARIARITAAAVAGYDADADPSAQTPADPRPASPFASSPRPPSADSDFTSARDLDCLAAAVYYEARGEPAEGQAAVAQVVLNRARRPHFPKSVCAVVFQGAGGPACQFSFACNGAMDRAREPRAWARARDVAARALGGYVMAAIGGATAFHGAPRGAGAGEGPGSVQLGGHVFYTAIAHAFVPGRASPAATSSSGALAHPGGDTPRFAFVLGVLTALPANGGGGAASTTGPRPE